jgi:siroheme synthase-like protein
MRYLPILVDLAGRACLVIGGGAVAARKVDTLLGAGAEVTVVAPRIDDALVTLAASRPTLRLERRRYRRADLAGKAIAFAATNDAALQEQIACDARAAGVWLNAVDEPERCSFLMPAILDRDPLVVAVSTSGESPALARRIRDDVGRALGPEYGTALARLAHLRARFAPGKQRQEAFLRLVDGGLLEALRRGDEERVATLIRATCDALPELRPAAGEDAR